MWTTVNGVNGCKFTGPNGGSIFLPAAGYRRDGEIHGAGVRGDYWSSTIFEDNPYDAYSLFFNSGNAFINGAHRDIGLPVRPVR